MRKENLEFKFTELSNVYNKDKKNDISIVLDIRSVNKEPITLTDNTVPIFDNASVWFELKTVQKINLGTHTFFIGEIIDCKTHNPDERVAYMGDTRMKYGGVPRGGH